MSRPIEAVIQLSALAANLAEARVRAGSRKVWAVAKANGYGHGLGRVLPAFTQADGLAILDLEEAVLARRAGWTKPIILLEGCFTPDDWWTVSQHDLISVVHHEDQLRMLELSSLPKQINIALKVDTGLNRLGFPLENVLLTLERLSRLSNVSVKIIMTHLACADADLDNDSICAQVNVFNTILPKVKAVLPHIETSLANSAALFRQTRVLGDWVRPGIALYGSSPFVDSSAEQCGLQATMDLNSALISVRWVNDGDRVGYGERWRATKRTRVGVVACGYADGYPRHAPDGTPVWVNGRIVPLAGRVSMDMLSVDLGDDTSWDVGVGAPAVLWGQKNPIDNVAQASGTIGYELMCALAPRVKVSVKG